MDDFSRPAFPGRIGERWVLRVRLADGSATDVTGWVEQMDPDRLRLRRRDGTEVEVDPSDLVAARQVSYAYGGPDPRRTSAAELEHIAARAWVADWEPFGAWTLRAGGGFTGRANSCLAVGDPGVSLDEALARVQAYAGGHGIAPMVQVVAGSAEEQAIRAQGWTETYVRTTVLVARLSTWLGRSGPDPQVQVSEEWTPEWAEAYSRSRPTSADPDLVRRILTSSPPRAFGGVRHQGRLISIGRGQLTRGWLGIASVWTDPEHRHRGLGSRVMRGLGHWAARQGARSAYLQVAEENEVAVRAYERIGFTPHHRYLYLAPRA